MAPAGILAMIDCSLLNFRSHYDSIMLSYGCSEYYFLTDLLIFLFELLWLVTSPIELFFRLHHQTVEILVVTLTVPSTVRWWWTACRLDPVKVNAIHNGSGDMPFHWIQGSTSVVIVPSRVTEVPSVSASVSEGKVWQWCQACPAWSTVYSKSSCSTMTVDKGY